MSDLPRIECAGAESSRNFAEFQFQIYCDATPATGDTIMMLMEFAIKFRVIFQNYLMENP